MTTEAPGQPQPQVIITLAADGTLQANLPSHGATLRKVPLTVAEAGATILRILEAQVSRQDTIGLAGAPTRAQVEHWEHHDEDHPKATCRFCQEQGWLDRTERGSRYETITSSRDGVEVRRIKPKVSGLSGQAKVAKVNPEDIGL